jgi:mRNA interferase RelE/StbE
VPYKVTLRDPAPAELAALPKKPQRQVAAKIDRLVNDPRPLGAERLKGSAFWRIRSGDYRIIYEIQDEQLTVRVLKIGNRKDVYDALGTLVRQIRAMQE